MLNHIYEINDVEFIRELLEAPDPHEKIKEKLQNSTIEDIFIDLGAYISNLQVKENALIQSIEKLRERCRKVLKDKKILEDIIKREMEDKNLIQVENSLFDIKLVPVPDVEVYDEQLVPEKYFTKTTTQIVDKITILRDKQHDYTLQIPGVEIIFKKKVEIK